MDSIVFLIFRRMRRPLMTLLLVYSISILVLTLIPGQDSEGNSYYLDFFHAFYFISFMSTTIGFGEIPYEFTDAQRLWVIITMYAGVISWLYAIGTILALIQDKTFQHALSEKKLSRKIKGMTEPFYLICGYGETGSTLVRGLTDKHQRVVIIENDENRRNMIRIDNLRDFVPSLHGDAQKPLHLQEAGLEHPLCRGVVALTDDNDANLKIAVTSKLLHPNIKVICRSDSPDIEKNMASFGTDHIIDPYETFAKSLVKAFQLPCLHLLQNWLYSANAHRVLDEPVYPPQNKHWVVCGFGRFGKSIYERLINEGLEVIVIEADPSSTGEPMAGIIQGRGTEANTLSMANIENACGLIAGTNNDANNLSIVVTARQMNPNLFIILRQNHSDNNSIIDAVKADMVMHPSKIIADKIRVLLANPMLYHFFSLASFKDNAWACEVTSRISALVGRYTPQLTEISINESEASAVIEALTQGESVKLEDLQRDPWKRRDYLKCIVLMIEYQDNRVLLPPPKTEIKKGDRLLVCAGNAGFTRFRWNLQHDNVLSYVRKGTVVKHGWFWELISKKKK